MHLLDLSVQNALDYISESFNFKNFSGGECPRTPLESRALGAPDGRYRVHIATILYLSAPSNTKSSIRP